VLFRSIRKIFRRDEFGSIINGLEKTQNNVNSALKNVSKGVAEISGASSHITTMSKDLYDYASDTSQKATHILSEANEMNSKFIDVSHIITEMIMKINAVAGTTEELSSTINEIAKNAGDARFVTTKAAEESAGASSSLTQLDKAAQDIATITETISDISSQTNLLALNATIEASRAGEFGKGFAVVAGEIKDLANQTADATKDIKSKVSGIQQTAIVVIDIIQTIQNTIQEASDIVISIASAIEEQSSAVKEVALNISTASGQTTIVNNGIQKTTESSKRIISLIDTINNTALHVSDDSRNLNQFAESLISISDNLKTSVDFFKL
jgi:methyl-accepting chemotaxis protein